MKKQKNETNQNNLEKTNSMIGLKYTKVICITILGMTTLIGTFFGKNGVLAIGMIVLSILFIMMTLVGDKCSE